MSRKADLPSVDMTAIDWMVRQRDPSFDGWEAFGDWLAADPAHAEAYHRAAMELDDVDAMLAAVRPSPHAPASSPLAAPLPAPASRPVGRARWGWAGAAAAAAALAVLTVGLDTRSHERRLYAVETLAGERREVVIDGSARVALNGGTRLTLDRADPRYAALDRGQALFEVVHDAGRPFRVEVAGSRLVDVGTRFEVVREGDGFDLGVAEGEVRYERGPTRRSIVSGSRLTERGGRATQSRVPISAVGSWMDGRLVYDGAPIARVGADLSRSLGVTVSVRPSASARSFRGVIILDGGAARVMPQLGPLLGLTVRRTGSGWEITS